ncbi:CU044_5270 family protein [Streptosporangium canum]|uniref:CU044_5270 family protein n=1 Tax=Streptosporangium canum TaxID=324952 RepID=UPI0036B2110A
MDDLTLLRDLYDAPPPSREVISGGAARLAAAYAQEAEPVRPVGRSRPARRSARARLSRWGAFGVGLLGAAAAMAVVIGGSGTPEPKPVLSASQILLAAADSVSTTPQDGKYWVRSGVNGREQRDPTGAYTIRSDQSIEIWLPRAAGQKTWVIRQDLGAKPATPKDEAAWRAAGSPASWTFPGTTPALTLKIGPGERDALRDASGKALTLLNTPMTPETLSRLPTTPEGLRGYLEKLVTKAYGAERVDMNAELFETGSRLIMNLPTSPEVRAATYRMLAALPGATAQGAAADPLGRVGQAVSRPGGPGEEYRLVVDTATGQPLALESSIGQDRSFEAVKRAGWTDEEPDLPARRTDMNRPTR